MDTWTVRTFRTVRTVAQVLALGDPRLAPSYGKPLPSGPLDGGVWVLMVEGRP
jgi:hypothetical protein